MNEVDLVYLKMLSLHYNLIARGNRTPFVCMHFLFVANEQDKLQLNVRSMLEDEIVWLSNFVPSDGDGMKEIDNALLAGHLQSIRNLLTCAGVDKNHFGELCAVCLHHQRISHQIL
jgi:hypothetical protein